MRPEILFPLFAPIAALKGVGPRLEPLLAKLAGPLVRDVLYLTPQNLIRREPVKTAQAAEGEEQTMVVTIEKHLKPGKVVIEFLPLIPKGLKRLEFMTLLQDRIETATTALVAEGRALLAR